MAQDYQDNTTNGMTGENDPGATVFIPTTPAESDAAEMEIGATVYDPSGTEGNVDIPETQLLAGGEAEATGSGGGIVPGTMIGEYLVLELISDKGSESSVFLVRKSGQQFALKLFRRAVEFSVTKLETLKNLECPFVASLMDYGTYNGSPYEVYEYYKNGTIEQIGKVDIRKLTEYVNQLNEGLHALHTLGGWNMIHGDLKPANIFLSNDGEQLLIGDFGISAVMNGEDFSLGAVCGTPEFAPPTLGVVNRAKRTTAFDYGSLGLVIYFLATGRSYFKGMSTDAIAQTWIKGIQIPAELDTRVKMLLNGLLVSEERLRYGYEDVKNWYSGSFVQVKKAESVFAKKQSVEAARLWFGIFDGRSIEVSSIPELISQMKAHWQQALLKLSDMNFYAFLNKIEKTGTTMSERIRKIYSENSADAAVFKTIYFLSKDSEIVYKGKSFGDAKTFVSQTARSEDPDAKELLLSGLFSYYLEQLGYPEELRQTIDEILVLKDVSDSFKLQVFYYMFSSEKEYHGCSDLAALRTYLSHADLAEMEQMVNDEMFLAWLYAQGMGSLSVSMLRMSEAAE